ncbi:hypothetical protein [Pelagicoccus sp. SDUM812002]|uniref:hypothetical protein n=1 Tax=Pelagicoccus sp. SDUM812002 TaxID=3041266 RepID=UPI00280F2926|nr:hypothetical protein [Pelagicoccus sp. SDUM812002]MDQ8187610.1 hypothetical protein [Pelagicoccus sp. SDUM812002]
MSLPASIRTVWSEGRGWLADHLSDEPVSFQRLIWPIVLDSAERAMRLCGVRGNVSEWLEGWMKLGSDPWDIFDEMSKACSIAAGRRAVDSGWALGESWRQLYPAIAQLVERGGLEKGQWEPFWKMHREMERIAFGPPLENMEKIVALMGAGVVRLNAVKSPDYQYDYDLERFITERYALSVDVHVDAVLPGFQDFAKGSLIGRLVELGIARRDPTSGGVEVTKSGALVGKSGQPSARLHYFGRATEGWLLGNDSLGRNAREGISQWAKLSVENASEPEVRALR